MFKRVIAIGLVSMGLIIAVYVQLKKQKKNLDYMPTCHAFEAIHNGWVNSNHWPDAISPECRQFFVSLVFDEGHADAKVRMIHP